MRNIYEKKTTGIITNMDFKSSKVKLAYWILYLLMVIISFVIIFPIIWLVISSFKDIKEFYQSPPTIIPRTFHPEKIVNVWGEMSFGGYYKNSIIMAAGDILFSITFNGLAGYVLSRLQPRGTKTVLKLILWTMMIPATAYMVPLFKTFVSFPHLKFNMINTYFPMWLISGANAFYIMMFKNFFDSISKTYVEAARIDGCTSLGIFAKIMLPLSKPFVFVIAMLVFNGSWSNFLYPYLILKDVGLQTVSVALYTLKITGNSSLDEYMIAVLLTIIPPMILFFLFHKQIMQGVNVGGIKG